MAIHLFGDECWRTGILASLGATMAICCAAPAEQAATPADSPATLVSVKKIWDHAGHNAFTDLIRFKGKFLCTFREADGHVKGDGRIRIIASADGDAWESLALLAEDGIDLRDPKISIMPDQRLMIVAGGSVYRDGKLVGRQPRVAFSKDGKSWTPTQRVLSEGEWLWRVTWHDGKGYGVSYNSAAFKAKQRKYCQALFVTTDGLHYDRICDLEVDGYAGETTLRFLPDATMIALVRRESNDKCGWIGASKPPYTQWSWHKTKHHLGGPDFIILPDGSMWAGSRSYPGGAKTVLARFGPKTYEPVLTLPSGGDTSYPGFVYHDNLLWMSYYASHEGRTSIYLAKIRLKR
ncbi:MAG: exo-alpha-sialidase [Phycisphaerae bacterium]|nr:exo-alpha-sialidase [Phycisphaerae bacterium]